MSASPSTVVAREIVESTVEVVEMVESREDERDMESSSEEIWLTSSAEASLSTRRRAESLNADMLRTGVLVELLRVGYC